MPRRLLEYSLGMLKNNQSQLLLHLSSLGIVLLELLLVSDHVHILLSI